MIMHLQLVGRHITFGLSNQHSNDWDPFFLALGFLEFSHATNFFLMTNDTKRSYCASIAENFGNRSKLTKATMYAIFVTITSSLIIRCSILLSFQGQ